MPKGEERPYHIASVGKMFTSTLLFTLIEEGKCSLQDKISQYLSGQILENLYICDGENYVEDVTIEHLVGHTSGIGDYFEGKVMHGKSLLEMVMDEPKKMWTPEMLLGITRTQQTAIGRPGQQFSYSDTGYILLEVLLGAIAKQPFHVLLHERIFTPLDMRDTYMLFHSDPLQSPVPDIEPVWLLNRELTSGNILSCDWSGGGIISTLSYQLKFQMALRNGEIITKQSLAQMDKPKEKIRHGMQYGLGMMSIHFGKCSSS